MNVVEEREAEIVAVAGVQVPMMRDENENEITKEEVVRALKETKTGKAPELADATAETKNTQNGDRRCTFARNDVILDCSNTLYDTKTARKIIPPATTTKLWMENNHIDSLEKKDIRDTYQGLADLKEVSFKNNFIRKVEGKG